MANLTEIAVVPEVGGGGAAVKVDRTAYLADLLKRRSPADLDWLKLTQAQAAAIVQELAIPSTRDENWRFTDLSKLLGYTWELPPTEQSLEACDHLVMPEATIRLVFMNGRFHGAHTKAEGLPTGAFVGGLHQLSSTQITQIQPHLAKLPGAEEIFTALNTASFSDAAIVWIPKNVVIEQPIHLSFLTRTANRTIVSQPRCLVILEAGAAVTLIEEYTSADKHAPYFTNAVTEIYLADNTRMNHTRLQWESQMSFHVAKTVVNQSRDSHYQCNAVNLGAALSRHNLEVCQMGEQADTQLYGLGLIDRDRTADTHSLITFTQPHGTATQLHKVIADDQAHGVFNGRMFVPQAAQGTDAKQLSRNLLLSNKARIDTKPELEIIADNVKCAHGATVSQLEEDEIFYLQSRGIAGDEARRLLQFAFAVEVLNHIPIASLRNTLIDAVRVRG